MRNRTLLFSSFMFVGCLLFHPMFGCGGKGGPSSSISSLDQSLTGQWVAEMPDPQGNTTLLVFEPTSSERKITVQAIRPLGDAVNVDQGTYTIAADHLQFSLPQLGSLDLPFVVEGTEPNQKLTLGEEIYFKLASGGAMLSGQIRITQLSADETVTVTSVNRAIPPHLPGEILARDRSGGAQALSLNKSAGWERIKVKVDRPATLTTLSPQLGGRVASSLEEKSLLRQAELKAMDDCKKSGRQCAFVSFVQVQSHPEPNDHFWDEQWNMQLMNMAAVFDDEATLAPGARSIVAIIDTGIRPEHPEISDMLLRDANDNIIGYDMVTHTLTGEDGTPTHFSLDGNGHDPDPTDPGDLRDLGIQGSFSSWHGTHLAGIIAAARDNGGGIAGINQNVKIMPIRAIGKNGSGYIPDVAQAIAWACQAPNIADCTCSLANEGDCALNPQDTLTACDYANRPMPDVVNLSLGLAMTYDEAAIMLDAVYECVDKGVTVVAAAGNDHLGPGYCLDVDRKQFIADADCKFYPAADYSVLSVGAITGSGAFAESYSNYGSQQFVVAPGGTDEQGVVSTVRPGAVGNNGYWELSGTSQSAAHLSGLVSLIKSHRPDLDKDQIRDIIKETAIYLGNTAPYDPHFGFGLINPRGALFSALEISPSGPPELTASVDTLNFGHRGGKATIILFNAGGGDLQIQGIETVMDGGGSWLRVEAKRLNQPTAPWALGVTIDRTSLTEQPYTGRINIRTNGGTKVIEVAMEVDTSSLTTADEIDNLIKRAEILLGGKGEYENSIDIGNLWIGAHNIDTDQWYRAKTTFAANYNFYLNLPPGKYQVIAVGENDAARCPANDAVCLGFPTFAEPTTIDCTNGCTPKSIIINK